VTMLIKRSLRIAGHRTSVALEPEFWDRLDGMTHAMSTTLPKLLEEIDRAKGNRSLASAARVAALNDALAQNVKRAA